MIPALLFSGFSIANAFAVPLAGHEQQQPLGNGVSSLTAHSAEGLQRLTGRFLHFTGALQIKINAASVTVILMFFSVRARSPSRFTL